MIDNPKYFHITADLSSAAFIGLYALISATIYHISQSLSLLIPNAERPVQVRDVQRNIRIYNICQFCIVLVYFGLFLWIFFTPNNISSSVVLSLDLGIGSMMTVIYILTVA